REAAVFGELLEHVIEESDTGGNGHRCRGIEIHGDVDVRFLRLALHRGAPFGERAHDRRPGLVRRAVTAHADAPDTEIAREFEVGVAVTHHRARGEVHCLVAHITFDQPY